MGMRRNVALVYENDNTIYLYTHKGEAYVKGDLRAALLYANGHWHDESYLARIILIQMVKDDFWGMTGDGIAPYETYCELPTIRVDLQMQTLNDVPFAEFVKADYSTNQI